MKMVQAEYLLDKPCQTCEGKEGFCFNVFCLPCQTGGLCSLLFNAPTSPHFNHDKIQVFKTSYQYVVRDTEMRRYFDTHLIQKYNSNGTKCCYLRAKLSQAQSTPLTSNSQRRSICEGCLKTFTLPRDSISNPGIVCSVECLLIYNNNIEHKNISLRRKARKQSAPTRSPMA